MTADPTPTPEQPTAPRYGDLIDEYGERAVTEIRERALSQEQRVIVHHGDPDSYARAYNEGYADAQRHQAAASLPAPEQDEAVRANPDCPACEQTTQEYNAAVANGLVLKARRIARRLAAHQRARIPEHTALATPPPVPAAPTDISDFVEWARQVETFGKGDDDEAYRLISATDLRILQDFAERLSGAVPAAPGLQEAVEGIENVLTGMDWVGTGSSQKAADDDERKAWQQWGVILSALGDNRDPHKRVYETGGDPRVAVPAAPGLDVDTVRDALAGHQAAIDDQRKRYHCGPETCNHDLYARLHPADPEEA